MNRFVIFTLILTFFFIGGCSGSNAPSKSELKNFLITYLPGHLQVKDFSIDASQNFGNEIEPNYGSRFHATVSAVEESYVTDGRHHGVTFARLASEKGKETSIYGKIQSRLYQGMWQHDMDIDGNIISTLGVPLNQVSHGRVIIRGSEEEKEYFAEVNRKEAERIAEAERLEAERRAKKEREKAELRENIANAKKLLVGTWGDFTGLFTLRREIKSDGSWYCTIRGGSEQIGTWDVKDGLYIHKATKKRSGGGKWRPVNFNYEYRIVDQNLLKS